MQYRPVGQVQTASIAVDVELLQATSFPADYWKPQVGVVAYSHYGNPGSGARRLHFYQKYDSVTSIIGFYLEGISDPAFKLFVAETTPAVRLELVFEEYYEESTHKCNVAGYADDNLVLENTNVNMGETLGYGNCTWNTHGVYGGIYEDDYHLTFDNYEYSYAFS